MMSPQSIGLHSDVRIVQAVNSSRLRVGHGIRAGPGQILAQGRGALRPLSECALLRRVPGPSAASAAPREPQERALLKHGRMQALRA